MKEVKLILEERNIEASFRVEIKRYLEELIEIKKDTKSRKTYRNKQKINYYYKYNKNSSSLTKPIHNNHKCRRSRES